MENLRGDAGGGDEVGTSFDEGSDLWAEPELAPGDGRVVASVPGGGAREWLTVDDLGRVGISSKVSCGIDTFEFAHANTGTAGEDYDDGQGAFEEHGAVTDVECIGLAGDLFTACAAGDKAMESADGAAGDGDKEEGQNRRRSFWDLGGVGDGGC